MSHTINKVREFHETFGHPVADRPTAGDAKLRELRVKLIAEELGELAQALGCHLYLSVTPECELTVLSMDISVQAITEEADVNLTEAADALTDLDYVVQGANLAFGFPAEELVAEVHRSNMSKLGEDGKPIYREDGKIMKGPHYSPPNLLGILASKLDTAAESHGVHGGEGSTLPG